MAEAGSPAKPYRCEPLTKSDPRSIGPYEIIGRLGSGAMGRVYLARRASQGAVSDGEYVQAAVKVIHAGFADDPQYRQRFSLEIAAARRVANRRTAAVLDADADADQPWVATEYVPGQSLAAVVEQDGPWDSARVRRLARGVATALVAVHDAGIVHRDLKPANVLIGPEGPKVIDFGIARAIDQSGLTSTGHVLGTPAYMAPEQAEGITPAGPATDVFALGGLLVFAASGRPPFGAGRPWEIMHRVVAGTADLEGVAADDPELRTLIEACLAKDPAARPSAAEVLVTASRPAAVGDPRAGTYVNSTAGVRARRYPEAPPTLAADAGAKPVAPPTISGAGRTGFGGTAPPKAPAPHRTSTRREAVGIAAAVVLVTGALAWLTLVPDSSGSQQNVGNVPTSTVAHS